VLLRAKEDRNILPTIGPALLKLVIEGMEREG
jgi:hypothetical protein